MALVEQREGIVPEVLRKMSADPAQVARAARELLAKLPQAYGGSQPGLSPRLRLVTDLAQAEAERLKDEFVSTEHLLIALASETGRSPPRVCSPTAASRATRSSTRSRASVAHSASPARTPRARIRRSSATAAT